MIQRKIAQLGDDDRRLLLAASAQGYTFDSAVVARALAMDAGDVEERLQSLDQTHGFVSFREEEELPDHTLTLSYRFVHVLYQNALFETLTPSRRAALSAAVASACSRSTATTVRRRIRAGVSVSGGARLDAGVGATSSRPPEMPLGFSRIRKRSRSASAGST